MQTSATVVAKTQNRTALGIVHAYVALNPNAKLADLRKVFPNKLCPDSGVGEILLPYKEAVEYNQKHDMRLYFTKDDEVITVAKGVQVCLSQIWSKASLEKFVKNAAKLGIKAADPDKELECGRCGFRYDILSKPKGRGCLGWIGLIFVWIWRIFVVFLVLLGIMNKNKEE